MRSFKIIAVFCALTTLTGCAMRRYRPVPLSPAQTAASLKARSLADPGLRVFIAKFQSAPATWPLAEWSLADLTLAAFYYNPALAITRGRLSLGPDQHSLEGSSTSSKRAARICNCRAQCQLARR